MEQYRYRALDPAKGHVNGLVDAESSDIAVTQLQERGLLVLWLEPSSSDSSLSLRNWFRREELTSQELTQFTQQLATLLNAGQSLERALSILIRQPGAEKARQLVERIRDRVKGGQTLSSSMALEGRQFSPLYLSLVRAGEAGGALGETLDQLAIYLERVQAIRGEVLNALIYPAFLLVGVLGSLALLLAYVVPQFVPIFSDLGVPIPLITEIILELGQFLEGYGLYLLATLIGLMWVLVGRLQNPQKRLRWDRRMLHWRVTGPLLQRLETAKLARTLGTLLNQGVPLITALGITRQVCANRAMQAAVEHAITKVKGGSSLSAALGAENVLPDLAVQMIQVGQESGRLDAMLLKVATVFDNESKRSIDRLLAALVPTLTLVMAALVALIMLAIMLPLMSLTSNI